MLTLEEVLDDVAQWEGFEDVDVVDVNSRGRSGITPLHVMATLGDENAARLLLDSGADINAADERGHTPLHEAIILRHQQLVAFLVSRGASIKQRNMGGETALDLAADDEDIKNLLARGA